MGGSQGGTGECRPEFDDDLSLLHAVLDTAQLAVIVLDQAGRIVLFNQACSKITGFSAAELLGREIFDILIPYDQRDAVREVFGRLSASDFPKEHENDWLTRSGKLRRLHWNNTAILDNGRIRYIIATGIDVTEERRAEIQVRSSQARLQQLVDASPALVGQLDRHYRFVFANREYKHWFGLDPVIIIGQHVERIIGQTAFETLKPYFDEALAGKISRYTGMVSYEAGVTRMIHGVYVPSRNEADEVDGLYIMALDLTEQMRLAAELDDSARRSRTVLDTAIDGIITITPGGIIKSFNHAAEKMFGYAADEVIGHNVSMLMAEPHHSRHDEYLRHYLKTGEKRIIGIGREVTAKRKDGSLFPIELAVGEFEEKGEQRFTGFTRDISDRKRAEAEARERLNQLAHVSRISAMGDLASGIAHEVNQPLAAIVTTAQACLRLMSSDRATPEMLRHSLEQIVRQGERASNVIREMREFLKRTDSVEKTPHDANLVVHRVRGLMEHELSEHQADVNLSLSEKPVIADMNPVQIEQVLLNLVRNALEAAESAGRRPRIRISSEMENGFVRLAVEDNGCGVSEDARQRLFEPFFTTKANGMGQGLSISRSLVRAHEGEIRLLSSGQGGSCFVVELPAAGLGR